MLKVSNIQTFYGNIQVLNDVSIEIGEGEIVTLIGANGAGKSTTLMSICGIVKLGISQVPEGRRIFPYLTVLENLDMGAFLRKDKVEIRQDLEYVFELFPILRDRRSQIGGTLSGGEQQMLAISRALMARPKLLLLDEPSLGLAPLVMQLIFQIVKKVNREQRTSIFLVEQNANQALQVANKGYVMENGRITLYDDAGRLLHNEEVKRAYLGI